jgi:hypothetical protein
MSPLFDDHDWSRTSVPDVPLPSFLRDDRSDAPGPSDVSLTFQSQGPSYRDITPTTSAPGSAPEPASYRSPAADWDPLVDPWPLPTQAGVDALSSEHPSGPLPRTLGDYEPTMDTGSDYDVTLNGALGYADLGFRAGQWFSLVGSVPRPISTGDALRARPELGGPIVQVACWWMREHPTDPRALDIATELAFAVGEFSREASRSLR